MIALKVLKYKILEWCIDTCFSLFKKNLTSSSKVLRCEDIHPGMFFSHIRRTDYDYYFTNCKIIEIEKDTDGTYNIMFHHNKGDGLTQYRGCIERDTWKFYV